MKKGRHFWERMGAGAAVGIAAALSAATFATASPTPDAGPIAGGTVVSIDCADLSPMGLFAAGGYNAMIVTKDDKTLTWGDSQFGANANGGSALPSTASMGEIPAGADIVDADYDLWAGYVLTADGSIYDWGLNASGQLGIGTFFPSESSTPVKVLQGAIPSGVKPVSIAAGSGRAAVLADNGWVYSWGEGPNGDGTGAWRSTPVAVSQGQVPSGVTFTQIANGNGNTYALGTDGWIYAWGENFMGANGNGGVGGRSPVRLSQGTIPSGVTFTQVAAGSFVGYGLGSDGNIYSWGNNGNGTLGIGDTSIPSVDTPVLVSAGDIPAGTKIVKIVASEFHTLALASDGAMYAWGYNSDGQLGNNTTTTASAPVKVDTSDIPAGVQIRDIEVGLIASFGLGSDGRLYSWGALSDPKQLGSNASAGRLRPGLAVSFNVTAVTFDGTPGTNLNTSACPITVATPPHAHGPVDVAVTTALIAGTTPTGYQASTVYPNGFTYVDPPVITTLTLPNGTVGTAYSATVQTTGAGPITLAVTAGALPAGMTLDAATGSLSGTPTAAGTYTFTVTATNQYGTDSHEYTVTIADGGMATPTPTPTVTPTATPTGDPHGGGTSSGSGTSSLAITGGNPFAAVMAITIGVILAAGGVTLTVVVHRRRKV